MDSVPKMAARSFVAWAQARVVWPEAHFSSRRFMSATERSATARASGSASSSANLTRPGSRFGRNGAASVGSSTSLAMFVMIRATWRFRAVSPRWLRARASRGTTIDNVAESTDWTNVVADNLWTVSGTSEGRIAADTSAGRTWSMSLFPESSKHSRSASAADVATSFLVSHRHATTAGTSVGNLAATCVGAREHNDVTPRRAATRDCHGFSVAVSSTKISTKDPVLSAPKAGRNLGHAPCAAVLTLFFLDPKASSTVGIALTKPASSSLVVAFFNATAASSATFTAISVSSGVVALRTASSSSPTRAAAVSAFPNAANADDASTAVD
mmetsp:Transcript_23254/g.71544  ORF Transcript_23254/g.71544 Transcript_23254/m.71544 type:complete len:328 (-) Transcript_23254:210-1193(-)